MTIRDRCAQLGAATPAAAAEIINQCAASGELPALLAALDHDYIIDGGGRGYMAALIALSRNTVLDLRGGSVARSRSPSVAIVSHQAYEEANRIMEDMFLSGADMDVSR